MGTLLRILVILAIWLLYVFFLTRACSPQLCEGCGETTAAAVTMTRYPIDFQWNDAQAFTNAGYPEYRGEILSERTEDNILVIIGSYYEGEEAPEGYPNMGLARAAAARQLMAPDLPDERVLEKARLLYRQPAGIEDRYFESLQFDWIAADNVTAPTIEELEDRIHIRFAFDSDIEEYNPTVDSFLQQLVLELRETPEVDLRLIGHTDSQGDPDYNLDLGLRRAEEVRDKLIGFGLSPDRISVASEGATHPIASNETARGRHENRRVEIRNVP